MLDGSIIRGPIAVVGANGMLAQMVRKRAPEGLQIFFFDLPEFDITELADVLAALSQIMPRIIINCAAFTAVDLCEEQEELATRVNGLGVANLAATARIMNATLVHISTDYVFSGDQDRPYREDDPTNPVSAYGRSKLKGEQAILSSGLEAYFVIRTSWLYGPYGNNFVETILRLALEKEELRIIDDQIGCPTYTGDLADAIFNLLRTVTKPQPASLTPCLYGIYHFSNAGQCSWFDFARAIVAEVRRTGGSITAKKILPIKTEEYPLPAKRPAYSVFDKGKYTAVTGRSVPDWRVSLASYIQRRKSFLGE